MREYESFDRIGVLPHRSYYIPFSETDKPKKRFGIIDRNSSSRFISLDGEWLIKQHNSPKNIDISEPLSEKIPVPSCVQMHGYDKIQYINDHYPFPVTFPHMPNENPTWHYRKAFRIDKKDGEKYYLNFEGVDSAFYLYVNGAYVGYSQISHATSEFDITELIVSGENTLDVVVLKWCVSSYLECQDKFRFSGIFRSVYILKRPKKHITDYTVTATVSDGTGILLFKNQSKVAITLSLSDKKIIAAPKDKVEIIVDNAKTWSSEAPNLYTLKLFSEGEVIFEEVGFRNVKIDGKVFKINGEHTKLKGVNRHDSNCKTGATVTLADLNRDIKLMRELNVNAVRTSHYPNMPEFYKLCDLNGIYVMDEADIETHGSLARYPEPKYSDWADYAESEVFEKGIFDRLSALYERDKNRPSVIIWSLGNESFFGKAFYRGARYIKSHDKIRPVHYESLSKKHLYTKYVDMASKMYSDVKSIKKRFLENEKETRPFVLCEYTHAMGNSCGDIAAYWDLIYSNEQCMGAFVWEWCDHAIKTKKGFLYGGEFGEREHDGNFCCDGLLTSDRKIKSAALEMKAVYGGKTKSEIKKIEIPKATPSGKKLEIKVDENTGCLSSVLLDGKEVLAAPMKLNIVRYIDNDRRVIKSWDKAYRLFDSKPELYTLEKTEKGYTATGVIVANCLVPSLSYAISCSVFGSVLEIEVEYKISDHIKNLPRFGFELLLDRKYNKFDYIGFGPTESYVDKNAACEYGHFESTAEKNYDYNYVRPQESGSHYHTEYLHLDGLFSVTAEKPFSFSHNPYTTAQLYNTKHNFELDKNDYNVLCLDLAMRGIGSNSCGPELDEKYEIPREYKNKFKIVF